MLTIFTIPKPFEGQVDVIQRNALESWSRLPGVEIFLFGDESGIGEAASEFGADHIPEISRNDFGTPLVGPAFDEARRRASQPFLCFANSDLILFEDLLDAVREVSARFPAFLIAGQRWNLPITRRLDFAAPDWESRLRAAVAKTGKQGAPSGSDYFAFPRELDLGPIPAFAIGRPGWDNWTIHRARALRIPTVDASKRVTVVHQLHDYSHIPSGAVDTPRSPDDRWEGPEADANRAMAREDMGFAFPSHLFDATHLLTSRSLRPPLGPHRLVHRWRKRKILPLRGAVRDDLASVVHEQRQDRREPARRVGS